MCTISLKFFSSNCFTALSLWCTPSIRRGFCFYHKWTPGSASWAAGGSWKMWLKLRKISKMLFHQKSCYANFNETLTKCHIKRLNEPATRFSIVNTALKDIISSCWRWRRSFSNGAYRRRVGAEPSMRSLCLALVMATFSLRQSWSNSPSWKMIWHLRIMKVI